MSDDGKLITGSYEPFYDSGFSGPVKSRKKTDGNVLVLFYVVLAGWAIITLYANTAGNIQRIIWPKDSFNNICGVDEPVIDKKYSYYIPSCQYNAASFADVYQVNCLRNTEICVEKCPEEDFNLKNAISIYTIEEIKKKMICVLSFDKNKIIDDRSAQHAVDNNHCAASYSGSTSFARRCIPVNLSPRESLNGSRLFVSTMAEAFIGMIMFMIISVLVCIVYIYTLRYSAGFIVYTAIYGGLFFMALGSIVCGIYGFNAEGDEATGLLGTGIALLIGFLVLTLVCCFLRKKIKIAIELIKEGSKAISAVSGSVPFQLLPCAGVIVVLFVSTMNFILLESIFEVEMESNASSNMRALLKILHVYNAIFLLWSIQIIRDFGEMTLAFVFSTWYWTYDKLKLPNGIIFNGMRNVTLYHFGTILLGSLIITLCRILRYLVSAIQLGLAKRSILCYCFCIYISRQLKRLQSYLEYLNRNAYIACVLHGNDFFSSASYALNLLLRNGVTTAVHKSIAIFFIFMSKILISLFMGVLTYYIYYNDIYEVRMLATTSVCILTYIISSGFLAVMAVALDTLFVCYLEDVERNDGSADKPYYMTKSLMMALKPNTVSPNQNIIVNEF